MAAGETPTLLGRVGKECGRLDRGQSGVLARVRSGRRSRIRRCSCLREAGFVILPRKLPSETGVTIASCSSTFDRSSILSLFPDFDQPKGERNGCQEEDLEEESVKESAREKEGGEEGRAETRREEGAGEEEESGCEESRREEGACQENGKESGRSESSRKAGSREEEAGEEVCSEAGGAASERELATADHYGTSWFCCRGARHGRRSRGVRLGE